jgi:hyperosmotically inducible protein
MKHLLTVTLLAVAAAALSACGGAVMRPVQFAFEDRTTDQQVTDNQIYLAAVDRLRRHDKSLLLDVKLDVWENRVLITGVIDSAEKSEVVARLVDNDQRIVKTYNALQVVTPAQVSARRAESKDGEGRSSVGQSLVDFWNEQKIAARLVATKDVASTNYRWRSVNNYVYVIGRATREGEKQRVLDAISTTAGVERVTEYVWTRPLNRTNN